MPKKNDGVIEVQRINLQTAVAKIIGTSPLIIHAWAEKSKREMLDKQMKKAKTAKAARDPEQEYQNAFHRLSDGRPGFPAIGIKQAMVTAGGRFSDGLKMTELRGMFFIPCELVAIDGEPTMREDMVRVGMGTADLRYRPEFKNWSMEIPLTYNGDAISLEQLVNLLNLAGFGVGLGEWRPARDGQYGMFKVQTE